MLYQESGLKGLSGVSSDMRALLASDAPRARLAVDFYAYRAAQEIGKLATTLGGLDALVFTAGIGANSAAGARTHSASTWRACSASRSTAAPTARAASASAATTAACRCWCCRPMKKG